MPFESSDHDMLLRLDDWRDDVTTRLERLESSQRDGFAAIARAGRLLPRRIALRITRRSALLIAIGAALGSLLGSSGPIVVQKLLGVIFGH